ncbi:energy transducer TonB [Sphingomonas mesophila]|uniref:energy transducer TonB n=1 Tax=Sphingomonas mesophila TaxID=2303576 RepID=UPI000E570DDA|nr:energy transducer TonB [Sphingomonas mesophila]
MSVLVASVFAAAAAAAATASPATSRWTIDFADAHCEASRTFSGDGKPLTLTIRPPLDPAASTRLSLEREKLQRIEGVLEKSASIDFGDGAPAFRTFLQPALATAGFRYVVDLPASQARRLREASSIEVKTAARVGGRFDLTPNRPMTAALDRCVADLRRRVGVGDANAPVVPATAAVKLDTLFSASNYWTTESHAARSSRVTASLLIDKSGAVRDCSIVAGTGSAALDTQSCQVFLRRVRYTPARGAAGEPVATLQHETVQWRR